jgi:hypothetical protein
MSSYQAFPLNDFPGILKIQSSFKHYPNNIFLIEIVPDMAFPYMFFRDTLIMFYYKQFTHTHTHNTSVSTFNRQYYSSRYDAFQIVVWRIFIKFSLRVVTLHSPEDNL